MPKSKMLRSKTRRKRINPVSARQRKRLALYRKISKQFLADHKYCIVCRCGYPSEIHHVRGRLGTLLVDTRFFAAVHPECHQRIHNHLHWAQIEGWIAPAGKWNTPPRDEVTDRLNEMLR